MNNPNPIQEGYKGFLSSESGKDFLDYLENAIEGELEDGDSGENSHQAIRGLHKAQAYKSIKAYMLEWLE